MRTLLDLAYRAQKWLWRVVRPRTRGVKVMLFNRKGEILLIRNSYGRTDQFILPGGGIRPWEEPASAAAGEIREEVGVAVTELEQISVHNSHAEGKRDTIYLFRAKVDADPSPDQFEVVEARFFALADLPVNASPATRRRVQEYLGERRTDESW